jgi:hypothetical protein
MPSDDNTQALRKRQQIENAGKNMFLWVAGAAAVFGICLVLAISLFERIAFRQEVIGQKTETVSNLESNVKTAETLKEEIRVLNTNEALLETPRLDGTEPLSVILDALPSTANSSALGASLQQKLLNETGVTVESLTVEPIAGVEDADDESGSSSSTGDNVINFQFTITVGSGQAGQLQNALRRLEKSIRTIDLTTVSVEQQGSKITLIAEGKAYYQPGTKVELKEDSCRPGRGC